MSAARTLYSRVDAVIAPACSAEDPRRIRTLVWLVTGLLLEQDARLSRIALAMDAPGPAETHGARVRRLRRWLDGPFDRQRCYGRLVRRVLDSWRVDRATLVLDTSSVCGRLYYVRIALVHASRTIPLAWRCYPGRSATLAFHEYRELLDTAETIVPSRMRRTLLADRGFQHLALFAWCDRHGWLYRVRAKGRLGVWLPDGTGALVEEFRRQVGALRVLDTVFLGAQRHGPAGLVLSWPRYGADRELHVLSPDAPSVRTLWEYARHVAIDHGFRDDKSACFNLERVRLTSPKRLDGLLLGIAIAELLLKSLATRLLLADGGRSVDAKYDGGLSLLQLGARALRADVWRGTTPQMTLLLVPDEVMHPVAAERQVLRAFYRRLGIEPGKRWIPPGSFEERNVLWWLQGNLKRYPPRMPEGEPPVL